MVLGVKLYKIFLNFRASYSAAQTKCEHSGGGGHLVSFSSEEDFNTIHSILMQITCCSFWWTGLRYTNSSDSWHFTDGADTSFALSVLRGKQYFERDKCVVIRSNGTIYPIDCEEESHCFCQTSQDATAQPTSAG